MKEQNSRYKIVTISLLTITLLMILFYNFFLLKSNKINFIILNNDKDYFYKSQLEPIFDLIFDNDGQLVDNQILKRIANLTQNDSKYKRIIKVISRLKHITFAIDSSKVDNLIQLLNNDFFKASLIQKDGIDPIDGTPIVISLYLKLKNFKIQIVTLNKQTNFNWIGQDDYDFGNDKFFADSPRILSL
jgi:hypothetical protein